MLGLSRSEGVVVGEERGYGLDRMVHCGWLRSGWGGVVCRVVGADEDVVMVVVIAVVVGLVAVALKICMVVAVVLVKATPLSRRGWCRPGRWFEGRACVLFVYWCAWCIAPLRNGGYLVIIMFQWEWSGENSPGPLLLWSGSSDDVDRMARM